MSDPLVLRRGLMFAALLAWAPMLYADVLTVGPAGAFPDIQAAVNAAADGDVVLVAAGTYGQVTIQDLSLTVTADSGANVVVDGGILVTNLAPMRTVVLRGLTSAPIALSQSDALLLEDNVGSVRVESCVLLGAKHISQTFPATRGALVLRCADVAVVGTTCRAGNEGGSGKAALPAADIVRSVVAFHGGQATGGTGSLGDGCQSGWTGGAGVRLTEAEVFASGTAIKGGDGGAGVGGACPLCSAEPGGFGGPGVSLVGSSPGRLMGWTPISPYENCRSSPWTSPGNLVTSRPCCGAPAPPVCSCPRLTARCS